MRAGGRSGGNHEGRGDLGRAHHTITLEAETPVPPMASRSARGKVRTGKRQPRSSRPDCRCWARCEMSTGFEGRRHRDGYSVPIAEGDTVLAACTVTVPPEGGTAGAVYRPLVVIRPTVELPPGAPFDVQFTFCVVALVTWR